MTGDDALIERGNQRGLYDASKLGPEFVAYLEDRRGMLAALRNEMSEGYRPWLDTAVKALADARDRSAEAAAALAELKAQLAAQEQTSDAVNAALWEAERQLAEARGATIEAKLAVANWEKYNGNMADEIVYQAEKMASAIRALPERTTP